MTYKEQLSRLVENIFKRYSTPGLNICDIATGGGKSYTIGKLTCEYYPDKFDRIVILCVQNKLVNSMDREIERFINTEKSLISPSDKIVIENNTEVITKAVKNGCFLRLLEEMKYQVGEQKNASYNVKKLQYCINVIEKAYNGLAGLIKTLDESGKNDYILYQINEFEGKLRRNVRGFFDTYKRHIENTKQQKKVSLETILKKFQSLVKVYPQVDYRQKRVLLMTIHKAMYGIDPIISDKIYLQDLADKKRKALILFDESDQAAIAMRNTIIDKSIENAGGTNRFAKGYNGYLQYLNLFDNSEQIANEYYGELLEKCLDRAKETTKSKWEKVVGDIIPYKSIFLADIEELGTYRRGVFFSGPALKLNISQNNDNPNSYICHKKNDRHFCLVHAKDKSQLTGEYTVVIPLDIFLNLIIGNTTSIKAQLRKVISESLRQSREQFDAEIKDIAANTATTNHYFGYPTLEREIHTLFSRFETISEYQFEQQINEFMTNRKNLLVSDGDSKIKLPDFSVYSQGVQLYQEEIDERDNQHRVRLSCREIATTPEKILIDLIDTDTTSVVLCSATASCWSVVSNFDIKYLKQTLGDKVHMLSKEDHEAFDRLVDHTYPSAHQIEIVPLERYEYDDKRENAITLPDKYKRMFSHEALEEGLADRWFRITLRELKKITANINNMMFRLYRLFQFIEAYHWFFTHDDIHSMIYFQNRTGDKDKDQINVISCLIDGTFKNMGCPLEDEIPTNWHNEHICISKDWEDVQSNILSRLSRDKDTKLMLVSAYGSFKAGTNMQYEIPEGLEYTSGDNWINEGVKLKKDWDAVYLQSPTSYLMMNEDGTEATFEKSLYNAMLTLMMLYERGCLSKADVRQWLTNALTNNFMFSERKNPGIIKDKTAWAQTTIEQAVGRLCRTRNKPYKTYILFDESMKSLFDASNMEKSLTKEFRALADYILSHQDKTEENIDPEEVIRCNDANYAQMQLDRLRTIALKHVSHLLDEDEFDDETEDDDELPYNIRISQVMYQSYKQTIIRKPTISSVEDLDENDKRLTFMPKCYGDWRRDSACEIFFYYDKRFRVCPKGDGKLYPYPVSPSSVRLDVLMKNPVIRSHFERNGFATTWEKDGLILHPHILMTDYAGEIGEEAFKAILLHYTDCTEENFKHLEGSNYELADFVITNEDGSYRIAFDVKNMNPEAEHNDKDGDTPTAKKRKDKRKQLNCELITVNMLQMDATGMDEIREIHGIIDENGRIIPDAIERIQKLINRDNI